MEWLWQTLSWYGVLLLIGIIFFPFSRLLFSQFADLGYATSKTIGILLLSYAVFLGGITHLFSFNQLNMVIVLLFAIGASYLIHTRYHTTKPSLLSLQMILCKEVLFLLSLLFLAYIRGQEPSIRGLEKFMDFGFMNSILRAEYFPPLDIWYASLPLNYYYFGHLTGAVLIKLTGMIPSVGYNLILATIFAQGMSLAFSLVANAAYYLQKHVLKREPQIVLLALFGFVGSFIVNFAGNLHPIYLFTSGYPNESPVPFWEILGGYNPIKYWYPNATRFIPFTIHEFPSYSYVVADLHGHVFDIPFVLLTLTVLFSLFLYRKESLHASRFTLFAVLLGFLTAIHYMTNVVDGPLYMLLSAVFLTIICGLTTRLLMLLGTLVGSFIVFILPFSYFFKPFAAGIGLNCSPEFLTNLKKLGPFLFEQGNCQASPLWMLFVLWGFFWTSMVLFLIVLLKQRLKIQGTLLEKLTAIDWFMLTLFVFGTFLIVIPEFFYIKDIYPAHFRANTMFKLGYQAFIMMGIASAYVLIRLKLFHNSYNIFLKAVYFLVFFFVFLYPFFAFPSYYGSLIGAGGTLKNVQLDGSLWLMRSFPEDKEIVDYLNTHIADQPVILEAQGDSYTDFERISAYTGLPTVAGWWVHEWLWRGSSDIVGKRIPDIVEIYESADPIRTRELLRKYNVEYVVVSGMERTKYLKLNELKFLAIGKKIFVSQNQRGAIYQIDQY